MNIKKIFISAIVLIQILNSFTIQAKEIKYKAGDIPLELKKNAKAVIRFEERIFEISSIEDAVEKVTFAITILNENGDDHAKFMSFYDKFHKIREIRCHVYDQYGKEVKKIRQDEIIDHTAVGGYTLYADNRVKYIDPEYRIYPYTIEYSYEIHYNGLLFYPAWDIYKDYNISIEKSIFTIISPQNLTFRYLEKNLSENINKNPIPNGYSWEAKNLLAIEKIPYSGDASNHFPLVLSAPNNFKIDGYTGNLENWNNFGKWINILNNGKDILYPDAKNNILEITKDASDKLEKTKIVYEYLQNKTRYVSIQIGIGGWQPFPATTVEEVGYGDCKALANYTKTLLSSIGIKSYYALVKAGRNTENIITDFPSNQFNHAFLCVPIEQDTIWLECTSQTNPFGYIGGFTDDRDVLLITEDGGKLVHTFVYDQKMNTQYRNAEVNINPDGHGITKINTIYSGLQYNNISRILYDSKEDQKKWLYDDIDVPSFEIKEFNIINNKNRIPSAELSLDLKLRNYASISGTRMFIPVNLMNKRSYVPKKITDRKTDIVYRTAYIDIDSITYTIPEGYQVEYIPEKLEINTEFGEYYASSIIDGNTVKYVRNIKMNKGQYPASNYTEFRDFLKNIANADKKKMVLVKKN